MKKAGEDSKVDDTVDKDEITSAMILSSKIKKLAKIEEFAGDAIATIPELPMLVPRGKYSLDLQGEFAKFHGRT